MYIKKATGRVVGARGLGAEQPPCKIVKQGRVLRIGEETGSRLSKSSDLASIASQGALYYRVIASPGACETCAGHSGRIYSVAEAIPGYNQPPFHPNCKCAIQEYDPANPGLVPDTLPPEQPTGDEAEGGEETFSLPGVHFEGKPSPLSPLEVTLPSEWTNYANEIADMLDIDPYLVLAIILHESGGNPDEHNTDAFDDPMQQASGLMQIIPYWHQFYQEGEVYYDNYADLVEFAEESGADISDIFDPLGNITVALMILNERRKAQRNPADMREWVGLYGQGYDDTTTTELLFYRDRLAAQDGLETWYSDDYYTSLMKN